MIGMYIAYLNIGTFQLLKKTGWETVPAESQTRLVVGTAGKPRNHRTKIK